LDSLSLQSTPVGTTIFAQIKAEDIDAGVNGLVEYYPIESAKNFSTITPENIRAADGYGIFSISFPHNGHVSRTSH
jgi:protocadherin-15